MMPSPNDVLRPVLLQESYRFVPRGTRFVSVAGSDNPHSDEEYAYCCLLCKLLMLESQCDMLRRTEDYRLVAHTQPRNSVGPDGLSWTTTVVEFNSDEFGCIPGHQIYLLFHEGVSQPGVAFDNHDPVTQLVVACEGVSIDLMQRVTADGRSVVKSEVEIYIQWLELLLTRRLAGARRHAVTMIPDVRRRVLSRPTASLIPPGSRPLRVDVVSAL